MNNVTTQSTPSPYNCAKRTINSWKVTAPASHLIRWYLSLVPSLLHIYWKWGAGWKASLCPVSAKGHRAADWEKTHVNTLNPDAEGNKGGSDKQRSIRSNREEVGEETQEKWSSFQTATLESYYFWRKQSITKVSPVDAKRQQKYSSKPWTEQCRQSKVTYS